MKTISTYTFKNNFTINQDQLVQKQYTPLTKLEHARLSTAPLYDETFVQDVGGYTVVQFVYEKRKEPNKDVVCEEVDARLIERFGSLDSEEITGEHIDQLHEEVYTELKYYAGTTTQRFKMMVDFTNNILLFEASRKLVDDVFSSVKEFMEGEDIGFAIFKPEFAITEKMLTMMVYDEGKHLPDPLMLVEKVNLGDKSELGSVEKPAKAKPATVKVTKAYPADSEVIAFVDSGKVVKGVQLEYDGVYVFFLDNTFTLTGGKFVESGKFEPDMDAVPSVNFMSQYNLQLPIIFDTVKLLVKTVNGVTI